MARTISRVGEQPPTVRVSLDAVIVAVTDETPRVLTVTSQDGLPGLPSGLLGDHRTLERALRGWVKEQTGLEVGYAEQLYTFGDRGRSPDPSERLLSIAYLALVREVRPSEGAAWTDWYSLLPWEDHRDGRPPILDADIVPVLDAWVAAAEDPEEARDREERAHIAFGLAGAAWDGVGALERYELLYELGLVSESTETPPPGAACSVTSQPMVRDHRRMVATAVGRLRGKITYRPVVFELVGSSFTLLQLQRLVEALAGVRLHKQNFRRLVEGQGLVEGTGRTARTGGRPAELFRFRREVLRERPRPGVGTPWTRA
ncbi:MAG: hypothetical protein S0880_05270 [Actinomycetota bacterium]|nr:hypothetical protein [Actinomycetota bacterium]